MRAAGRAAAIDIFELRVLFQAVRSLQGLVAPSCAPCMCACAKAVSCFSACAPAACALRIFVNLHNKKVRSRSLPGPDRTPCRGGTAAPQTARLRHGADFNQLAIEQVLNGQAGAATSAAASQDLAAILGGHTGTEAMHLCALTLLGLISSDRGSHNYTLLILRLF